MVSGDKLIAIGIPEGRLIGEAIKAYDLLPEIWEEDTRLKYLKSVFDFPKELGFYIMDFRRACDEYKQRITMQQMRTTPVPYKVWGREIIDPKAIEQLELIARLPVARAAAVMPDSHVGWQLPIGGVLATKNAIIPGAVGSDISCSMRCTIFDAPATDFDSDHWNSIFKRALQSQTRFGVGCRFEQDERRQHQVMDNPLWNSTQLLRGLKDVAHAQLGTSGTSNHFCNLGIVKVDDRCSSILDCPHGEYISLLTHSGSRGLGAKVADHYSKIAEQQHRLPNEAKGLGWLDLDTEEGQEYWIAMTLAAEYALANHQLIHELIAEYLGFEEIAHVKNSHNLAWKEMYNDEEVIVHRKGATPAGLGVLGVIPGTMADTSHLVRGLGNPESLNSSSHGAGRQMSRAKAHQKIDPEEVVKLLKDRGVHLISGGLDESPQAYKTIAEVMEYQKDLVESIAEFQPKIVIMAPAAERSRN